MTGIRDRLQHVFNPLHLFCRLRRAGVGEGAARALARWWELGVYRFILSR